MTNFPRPPPDFLFAKTNSGRQFFIFGVLMISLMRVLPGVVHE